MARDGFQKRTACFECGSCGRKTRQTAKQQNDGLCPHCDERTMMENGLSDDEEWYAAHPAEKAAAEAKIRTLAEQAAKLGGDRARLGLQPDTRDFAQWLGAKIGLGQ